MAHQRIVVLAGGVGGAKFTLGVRAYCRSTWPDGSGGTTASITVIANTGDDLWLAGLRVTPDLDSLMYALADVNDTERGWGRAGESERVSAELNAYGVGWPWFTLGDLDLGTHIARSSMLRDGLPLSAVVARLAARWPLGVTLLSMTDDEVETYVVVDDPASAGADDTGERELHFEEWWVRTRASLPAKRFVQHGVDGARPAPGVLAAIADADIVLVAPSNPVVSIGTILGIPGIRDAVATTAAPVVGLSPVIGGAVVRGMADACLAAIGVGTDAAAIARHYGSRAVSPGDGLLDGWLVDTVDAAAADALSSHGFAARAVPLFMTDDAATAKMVAAAFVLVDR